MLIYLIRHALPHYDTGVPYHIAPGPLLAEAGIEQAAATARLLQHAGIERVVSSPMRRCVMTAEPLCAMLGLDLQIDEDLGEMQPGEAPPEVALRMMRCTLAQIDVSAVALVLHAAPLEQLMLALTRGQLVLPGPDQRGARIGVSHVWQVMRRDGAWHARHLPVGGVRA